MSELSDLNPEAPPLSGVGQPDPIGDMRKLGANLAVSNKASEKPPVPTEFTQKADGSVTIKGDRQLMEYYGKAGQFYQQAMGGMQQQVDRLKQQEDAARNQPAWVQLATALSANLAQQKDMPGWVKGLGQTAAQMNPRPEQLAAQRMGLMGEQADLAGKSANLEMSAMGHEDARRKEARVAEEARTKDLLSVENNASIEARKTGNFDKALFINQRLGMGDNPQTAQLAADRLEGVAKDQKLAMAQAQATVEAKETAAETRRANHDIERDKEWWKRNASNEAAKDAREVHKEAIATAKDQKKQGQLGAVLEAKVEDILVAKRSTNRLLEIFDPNTQNSEYKHFQDLVGPIKGRETDMEKWLGTLNATDATLVAKINLQFANAVKTLGAGSYGYRISERGFLQSFTEALKNGAPQNYGNLKAWSTFYNDKVDSFKDIKPEYDWGRVDGIMQMQPGQKEPERKKAGTSKPDNDPMGIR